MSSSFFAHSLVARNVRNVFSEVRGAVVRVSREGVATVLLTETGKLARMPVGHLAVTRGRPIKLIGGLVRADIDELIVSSGDFRIAATRVMFARQTEDERSAHATRHDNNVGFRADDARKGSALALKSACGWTAEDHLVAIDCLLPYSGTQLWELASTFLTDLDGVESLCVAPAPVATVTPAMTAEESPDTSEALALIAEILAEAPYFGLRFAPSMVACAN